MIIKTFLGVIKSTNLTDFMKKNTVLDLTKLNIEVMINFSKKI